MSFLEIFLLIFSNLDMAGSHFSEHCLHECFFTLNYTLFLMVPVEAMMEVLSKHRMEQKVYGKTDVLLTGLWSTWAGFIF